MSDLINLNCPNCGGQLQTESTKMKTFCQHCGTEILIKDFITERRVDKEDMLKTHLSLAENAKRNKDYKGLYEQYKEICKIEASKENMLYLNLYGFYASALEFQKSWLQDLYILSPNEHREVLRDIQSFVNTKKLDRINNIPKNLTQQQRSVEINKIHSEYAHIIRAVADEVNKTKTKRCKCGAEIEFNEDVCPKCGTSYSEYQKEVYAQKQAKQKKILKFAVIIGVPLIILIIIISLVSNSMRVGSINDAIKNGNYSSAEEMLDDYASDNSTMKETYELYADLYLAQNKPEKAIEKLKYGLGKVSSSYKDDLQSRIDKIEQEYGISQNTEPATAATTAEVKATTEPPTQPPTENPKVVEEKFKKSCQSIDFKTLSRNPDKYKGNNYKFTGEVIQVQESDSWFSGTTQVDLRVNVTKKTYEYIDDVYWEDTIYATVEIPEGADRILEDDIITIWGTCDGNYSYTSVLGSTISLPKISIKYYAISE